jgi:p-hydroxybenzoate 3-monooxygenase
MRTKVAIIGSGPAGLMLGQRLQMAGIDNVIIEARSRDHVLSRIRAGVLEEGTAAFVDALGVGGRMRTEGLVHDGFNLCIDGHQCRIALRHLTGKSVLVYGQTELTRDLMDARARSGAPTVFEAGDVAIGGHDGDSPHVSWTMDGERHELRCDFIAGCDGFHGVCRASVEASRVATFAKEYPFGWLGVLADVPPVAAELIYVGHNRGFALCSMRSPTRSRYYLQCAHDEDADAWSDEAFWDELRARLDPHIAAGLITGPSIEKSVAPLRSFVTEPMRFGRLFLAGDAAHIVPPAGAKGLNLAASDVCYLSDALIDHFQSGSDSGLDAYSRRALERIWKAERFSWWMTMLLHRLPGHSPFDERMQSAEAAYLLNSEAAQTALAENYVGLPI